MIKKVDFYRSPTASAVTSLGLIFLLLFSMAFACNDGGEDQNGITPPVRTNRRAGGSPTEDDVKAWVTEYENMLHLTGVSLSEPDSIDFTFGEISFGQPRAVDTGDKLRKVESDYLYPVVVEYTIHQYFKDVDHPSEKKYNYELYRNAQGVWNAFSNGPVN